MKLFKSNEQNTFHYVTLVTYNRVPVFRSDRACEIFVTTLDEVRQQYPYKLLGYVIMPDHVHAIVNRSIDTISAWLRRVRGNSAREILSWLRTDQHLMSLKKLELAIPQYREIIRLQPDDAMAHANLACALAEQGKLEPALLEYKEALRLNQPLATAYYLKEDLRQVWSQPTKADARRVLVSWYQQALGSGIRVLQDMACTLLAHQHGILAWYDYPISTSPLEGTNNKIKTMQRQHYGLRDQEFFRLKIYALHRTKYALVG